jgi:hypothetical protein
MSWSFHIYFHDLGLATDPDFTELLLWKKLSDDVKNKIMTDGVANVQWGNANYPISKNLIEDGRKNLLLEDGSECLYCHRDS